MPDARATPPPPVDAGAWRLSETGLYRDLASFTLAAGVVEFRPAYALWSDGADKRRFIALPAGAAIDTRDMDHWQFPVGTRFWKEFSRDGRRLETRLIERTGPGNEDYWMGAFLWDEDGKDATFVREGAANVHATITTSRPRSTAGPATRASPAAPSDFQAFNFGPPATLMA